MSKYDPIREAHRIWLGLVQPVGLVVSPTAMINKQVIPDRNPVEVQQKLEAVVERPGGRYEDADPVLADFPRFAREVLDWDPDDLAGAPDGPELSDDLAVPLPEYHETLRPSYAVIDSMGDGDTLLLVSVVDRGADLDKAPEGGARDGWHASPQARFERLLRDTGVSAGLLCNGTRLRLVYAPRGESSGHIDFPVGEMCTVGGRPILAAMHMLLRGSRVIGEGDGRRLLDVLAESRKYQSEVSNRLADQVLGALWELLRGFEAANAAANGQVLGDLARTEPDHVYGGLLTVIMRLVFLLYAEDRGLLPTGPTYTRNYSVTGLYDRLRADAGRYPGTMGQRFGAWAGLLTTFRLVFDGGRHGPLQLPARHGELFNPGLYPFLEGRQRGTAWQRGEILDAPRVPDGTVFQILEGLLVLDGERLSYRALDVEQIGSVYESMMGFEIRSAAGRAVALRPKDVVVDLDDLLAEKGAKRVKRLEAEAESKLPAKAAAALKEAETVDDAAAALGRRLSSRTPRPLPPGALHLQPGAERRRTGSHYTPRELTQPIVSTTLGPVLEALGEKPTPEQILDLKVCDPAMGSGAFLVESCRQLAEALVKAWEVHDAAPPLPPDEDPLLYARRLVVQRCLYGVDKNPFAVSLAKLSLWLVTLARDHAFTFLDHALRHGDSLVGLTRRQIGDFRWHDVSGAPGPLFKDVTTSVAEATKWRARIQAIDDRSYDERQDDWRQASDALNEPRLFGDLCVAAFFNEQKDKARETRRREYLQKLDGYRAAGGDAGEIQGIVSALRDEEPALPPLHWEVEFPEVFDRENPGFDAMVGNPPFAGKNNTINGNRPGYVDWLKTLHPESHGNSDLVAHFFRRAFSLVREGGNFGLIATNTIGQGDTRSTGLRWICTHGGEIYAATKRVKWPGQAAVVVSVVHVHRGAWARKRMLDGKEVPTITAFLFHGGGHDNPKTLAANAGKSFVGSYVLGMGFTFDDTDTKGVATPIAEMERLIEKDPRNAERIFPYIGGQELNSSPTQSPHRYVINFGEMSEEEARRWPDLMEIVEAKVKPERLAQKDKGAKRYWWQFIRPRRELYGAIEDLHRVLVIARVSNAFAFTFVPNGLVFNEKVIVFPSASFGLLCVLQCRVHETWGRFFNSSLKDDMQYTPSECFDTFPLPTECEASARLSSLGEEYHQFRASLMARSGQGLTKVYNAFHDPNAEGNAADVAHLRDLHAAMDRAVLDAYGWTDIPADCDFFLDYEIDEATWGSKKKPWRYRWPDEVQDDVLARLMTLNAERHREEVVAGLHSTQAGQATPRKTGNKPRKSRPKPGNDQQLSLLGRTGTGDDE